MMKKLAFIMIIVFFVANISVVSATNNIMVITIQEAQELAVKNSKEIIIDDLEITSKQNELVNAMENAVFQGDSYGADEVINARAAKEVKPLEAQVALEVAKMNKQINIKSLKFEVYNSYLNLLLASKEMEMETGKLEILQEKLKFLKARKASGGVTINDINNAEYNIESKQNDISNIQENIKYLSVDIKRLLGLTLDEKSISYKEEINYIPYRQINIDNLITEELNKNIEVYKNQENLKVKEKMYDLTALYYKQGEFKHDKAKGELESAKIELEEAKTKLETDIRNKYNNIKSKYKKLEMSEKYLVLLKRKLNTSEVKFKRGLISKEYYLDDKEKYIDALYKKYEIIYDFNIAKAEFENLFL
ncbi:MAG: TolC family protein [Clostridia bacterium]|nr:TolC family protein [Clostridia bacterium]